MTAKEVARPSIADRSRLDDNVSIITGGAGFLGLEHARALAAAGSDVVLVDIQRAAAQEAAVRIHEETGRSILAVECDVADPSQVKSMVDQTLERFERVDVLINNAALDPKVDPGHVGQHSGSFEDFEFDDWQRALDVNVTGMFLCAQAVAPTMLTQSSGVIINVASTYGVVGPDQRLYQDDEGNQQSFKPVTYSVSKSAALGLTRYLAAYYARRGIRVNSITPGGVFQDHDEAFNERYSRRTMLGRMATPEEISSAVLFLASQASSYMTGANLVVDGGWTAW